jgi:hypothetical protein
LLRNGSSAQRGDHDQSAHQHPQRISPAGADDTTIIDICNRRSGEHSASSFNQQDFAAALFAPSCGSVAGPLSGAA